MLVRHCITRKRRHFVIGSPEWLTALRDGVFDNRPPVPASPSPSVRKVRLPARMQWPSIDGYNGKPCPYCGYTMMRNSPRFPTRDHVHPKSKGGRLDDVNRLIVCAPCNNDKADMTLEQWAHHLTGRRDARAGIVWALLDKIAPPGTALASKMHRRRHIKFVPVPAVVSSQMGTLTAPATVPVEYADPKAQAAFAAVYKDRLHVLRCAALTPQSTPSGS